MCVGTHRSSTPNETPEKELGSFLFVTTNYRRRAGQHRTCSNNHHKQLRTSETARWCCHEYDGHGRVGGWRLRVSGPGPASVRWERPGTVALLKALELIWITMVDDSGEVAESLESEVIRGLISAYWLFPMFMPPSSSGTPGVSVCLIASARRSRPRWTALTR